MSARLPPLLFALSSGEPEHQTKLHEENKQAETETTQGPASEWLPLPRNGWKKRCHHLSSNSDGELATFVLTDPLFDQLNAKRSSSIFQHHHNYLAKVSDAAVLQNTDENAGPISFTGGGGTHSGPEKQASEIIVRDILYYGYSGSVYALYNFPSRGSCCREMVIHNACILHYLSAPGRMEAGEIKVRRERRKQLLMPFTLGH